MGISSGTQTEFTPIPVREVPLTGHVGKLTFTKAIVEVNPPGCLAVVHYSISGKPCPDGIAIDLDKGIFLDSCEQAGVSKMASKIRAQILSQLRS